MGMSPEEFEQLVAEAVDSLPAWVHERLDNVEILVEEAPRDGRRDLLGLYEGIPLTERTNAYTNVLPDRITLFRRAIETLGRTPTGVKHVVRRTVVHEIAHFFGISDERLEELGRY